MERKVAKGRRSTYSLDIKWTDQTKLVLFIVYDMYGMPFGVIKNNNINYYY